ncbi:LysR family transcriptional regulator [Noviherbaspirillum malthae]|jgi:DNA-binding transcriptional LysR family regulator|uniref:LysR family transcriptional regulator n=1 Tax=Noviherbaspirillum malthae TaxID=1260987 RepID=UPI001890AD81|nr:LysR family transcriptional regulator [Noviherbaspirillum malthae]
MELRHLRYFVALAEELHFGRAALRLAITQPPLSFAIQSLEKELGIRLFERDNKRVELTPAGAAYYVEAQAILERIKLANDTARSVASGNLGRLDIGFTGSMVYRHVPGIVSDFIERHPGIEVTLREQSSMEQIEGLLHGRLHAGFINTPHVPEGLAGQPLPDDPFVCCLPDSHALAGRQKIALKELADCPFIMFAREVSPANYDNVIAICRQAGFEPQTRFAARQWLTITALVANGLGVSIVPQSLTRSAIAGARFVPILDAHAVSSAYLIWHPESKTPALQFFLSEASSSLTNHTLSQAQHEQVLS